LIKVAIIGAPNVGKSSLVNKLVSEKVSIVTNNSGTTRDKISGFVGDFEIIDTPGMTKDDSLLGKHMRKSISVAVADADVILYVLDAVTFDDAEITRIKNYENKNIPVIVLVNKADKVGPSKIMPKLNKLNAIEYVYEIIPISVKEDFNIDVLLNTLIEVSGAGELASLSENEFYTSQNIREVVSEIIRETVMSLTRAEIPHGVAVIITKYIEKCTRVEIHADIICEKKSHRPIILGKGGALIKRIGILSRQAIEDFLDFDVQLYTQVIAKPNWKNDKIIIMGMEQNLN